MVFPTTRTREEVVTLSAMMPHYKKDIPRSTERGVEMIKILEEYFTAHPYTGTPVGTKAAEKVRYDFQFIIIMF